MAKFCLRCRETQIDLAVPAQRRMAALVCDGLDHFGGSVGLQRDLLNYMWKKHGVAHETTQRYVDGLASLGYFRVIYYGGWPIRKCVRLIRRVEAGRPQQRKRIKPKRSYGRPVQSEAVRARRTRRPG